MPMFFRFGYQRFVTVLASPACIGVAALVLPFAVPAADWPHWRGPERTGLSTESGWLDRWPAEGPKVAWRGQVGLGFSSFAVAQGRVFTLGHADGKDSVFCFDAESGRELWRHSYPAELGDKFFDGGTTGTPAVDGARVYALSRWGDTFCLQAADGKVVWSKNVQKDTGARVPDWGFSGSPLVQGDKLVLNVGEAGLALNKETGAILWQSGPKSAGYSTPLPLKRGADELIVLGSGQSYVAVAARDGKAAFRIRWLTQYGVNAADPVIAGDRLFLSTGYDKGAALFKLSGAEPEQLWKSKVLRTQLNGAVLYEGHLYGGDGDSDGRGPMKCVELASGQEKWAHNGFGTGGLMIADGKLIALSARGEFFVAPATPSGFKPTARAQLLGGKCWTAPVLSDGRIFGRSSRGDVICLDVRTK